VDPVCHTLVGATLAESGLKRRTALGTATLLIAANLPDIDMLAYLRGGTTALWFRRGVTHGVIAWLVLPLALTAAMVLVDRLIRRRRTESPVVPHQVLLLASIGLATHPLLDFLNVYGIRLLMPFSDRWFYGDTLFIIDPWVWAALGIGVIVARRRSRGSAVPSRNRERAARVALMAVTGYIVVMGAANLVARRAVATELERTAAGSVAHIMVAPRPMNPFARRIVVDVDGEYYEGELSWPRGTRPALQPLGLRREPDLRTVAATRGPEVRMFLSWARFPYFVLESRGAATVIVGDARYTLQPRGSWASVEVPLTP
jgi:inner membrane protein